MNIRGENNIDILRNKIHNGKIKYVLFDLDGTLYSSKSGIEFQIPPLMVEQTSIELFIDKEESKKLLRLYREEFKSAVLGLKKYHNINPFEFYQKVYEKINISQIEKYCGLKEHIENLSKIVKIYLLSNSNESHVARVLNKLEIYQYFEDLFSVEYANFIRKPNQIAYEIAIENMGANSSEIINIDDSYLNLEVANKIGLHTILVSNGIADPPMFWEMHKKIFHEAPDFVNASFQNIIDAIEALYKKN